MVIESSFIPFPSEIVSPPAAYKAAQGDMNFYYVIVSGSAGALTGAAFNYYIAMYLGRKLIYRLCKTQLAGWLLIDLSSVKKAEDYFNKYGKISTFIGRLVPAVRQLISIPAGLSKMNLMHFIVFTTIGSTIWNTILAVMGYFLYNQRDLLHHYYRQISLMFVIFGLCFVIYLVIKNKRRKTEINNI
jgi:membrane protein DedA with SNARE-associated domain